MFHHDTPHRYSSSRARRVPSRRAALTVGAAAFVGLLGSLSATSSHALPGMGFPPPPKPEPCTVIAEPVFAAPSTSTMARHLYPGDAFVFNGFGFVVGASLAPDFDWVAPVLAPGDKIILHVGGSDITSRVMGTDPDGKLLVSSDDPDVQEMTSNWVTSSAVGDLADIYQDAQTCIWKCEMETYVCQGDVQTDAQMACCLGHGTLCSSRCYWTLGAEVPDGIGHQWANWCEVVFDPGDPEPPGDDECDGSEHVTEEPVTVEGADGSLYMCEFTGMMVQVQDELGNCVWAADLSNGSLSNCVQVKVNDICETEPAGL